MTAEPFLDPAEAAAILSTTPGTLNWRRSTKIDCPPYWKTSSSPKARVKYLASEIETWRQGEWTGDLERVVGQKAQPQKAGAAIPSKPAKGARKNASAGTNTAA